MFISRRSSPRSPLGPVCVVTAVVATLLTPALAHAGEGDDEGKGGGGVGVGDTSIEHNGLLLDAKVGVQGCTRSVCDDFHGSTPSYAFSGMLGWNFLGLVELGAQGGWGRVAPNIDGETNALALYGVDSTQRDAVADQLGLSVDDLQVRSARSQIIHAAPIVRFHFPRRGRLALYAGAGVGYILYRNDYDAVGGGDFRLDWHGVQIPVEAGMAVHASQHIAFTLTGGYRFAWYAAGRVDHPRASGAAPAGALGDAVEGANLEFDAKLPHLWTVSFGIRFTLLSRNYVL